MVAKGNLAKRKHYFTDYDGVLDDKSVTKDKLSDEILVGINTAHSNLATHQSDKDVHITAGERKTWNDKATIRKVEYRDTGIEWITGEGLVVIGVHHNELYYTSTQEQKRGDFLVVGNYNIPVGGTGELAPDTLYVCLTMTSSINDEGIKITKGHYYKFLRPSELSAFLKLKANQSDVNELRNEMSGLDVNITAHSSDEEMHITYDERALWNTVSDKAEQSEVGNIQSQMGDVADLPHITGGLADNLTAAVSENWSLARTALNMIGDMSNLPCDTSGTVISNMETINTKIEGVVCPELSTHSVDIANLQSQMGDIATILADIKADQEALINGGEE